MNVPKIVMLTQEELERLLWLINKEQDEMDVELYEKIKEVVDSE